MNVIEVKGERENENRGKAEEENGSRRKRRNKGGKVSPKGHTTHDFEMG
jgi:hypothetical protein